MKRLLLLGIVCVAGVLAVTPATAQMTPADSAAVLLGVANRLRTEGRLTLANSLLDLIQERYASTPAAAEAERMRTALRGVQDERSGKTELLVWTTIYGLSLGVLVPVAFRADDPEIYGLGLIAGGPGGFLLGRSILNTRPISEGQARAISFGTIWGGWQGLGWTLALNLGEDEICNEFGCFTDDADGETLAKGALFGSLLGFGTGLILAQKDIPAGTSTVVTFGGLWGSWYGFTFAWLADLDRNDEDNGVLLSTLIAGNVGIATTALLAPSWNLSRGRARLISITGVAGLLASAGVLLITQPEDEDFAIGTVIVGSAVGLGLGAYWTRNYNERSQARPGPGGDALLDLRDGRWSVNLPAPSPRMLEALESGRPTRELGIAFPLLKAAF